MPTGIAEQLRLTMSSTDALSRAWLKGPSAEPTGAVSVLPSATTAKLHAAIRTVLPRPRARACVRAQGRVRTDVEKSPSERRSACHDPTNAGDVGDSVGAAVGACRQLAPLNHRRCGE
jgi:hypothetical protein